VVICEKTYLLPCYAQIEQYLYIKVKKSIIKTVNCFKYRGDSFDVDKVMARKPDLISETGKYLLVLH
jgi:hypothetical protein